MDDTTDVDASLDAYGSGSGEGDNDNRGSRLELERLRQEHHDLDAAVFALQAEANPDQLQVVRMKKRKLILRDQIAQLEDRLTPDLIA